KRIKINEDDNCGTVHDRMMEVGAQILLTTIQKLEEGKLEEIHQPSLISAQQELHHAPKLTTSNTEINWNQSSKEVHNLIRGLSPYPAAFTFLKGKKMKVFESEVELSSHALETGIMSTDHKSFLKFAANDGYVLLKEIQLEGKKKMKIEDFLRGWRG
ncbi:MAG: methionyl-tRNA formyltransferase, partial [Ginsengibacter sp.]